MRRNAAFIVNALDNLSGSDALIARAVLLGSPGHFRPLGRGLSCAMISPRGAHGGARRLVQHEPPAVVG